MTVPESGDGKTTISLEMTDREGQILSDAIRFIWGSGAVQSKDAALELIGLEERINSAIIGVKDKAHGEDGEDKK